MIKKLDVYPKEDQKDRHKRMEAMYQLRFRFLDGVLYE